MAAQTLTEIFTDNEDLLEKVDDQTVQRFVNLLREQVLLTLTLSRTLTLALALSLALALALGLTLTLTWA